MPQVDLETLVSVCGSADRKIASVDDPEGLRPSADDPPQSFWLSQDAEFDWFDRNAVLERKDSTKGNNSNSNSTPSHLTNSHSNSQRLPVKKSILALPKLKSSVASDVKLRRNRTGITLFPRRSASTAAVAEPTSPKVSCIGRVRSKRDKNNLRKKSAATSASEDSKPKKKGFWKSVGSFFRSNKHEKQPRDVPAAAPAPVQNNEPAIEPAVEPVSLLGTKRFVSGRRADLGIDNVDPEPVKDLVKTGSLDCGKELRQRSVGPLSELNCGPAAGPVQT